MTKSMHIYVFRMTDYETGYQALGPFPEDEQETPPVENIIHSDAENNKGI